MQERISKFNPELPDEGFNPAEINAREDYKDSNYSVSCGTQHKMRGELERFIAGMNKPFPLVLFPSVIWRCSPEVQLELLNL